MSLRNVHVPTYPFSGTLVGATSTCIVEKLRNGCGPIYWSNISHSPHGLPTAISYRRSNLDRKIRRNSRKIGSTRSYIRRAMLHLGPTYFAYVYIYYVIA